MALLGRQVDRSKGTSYLLLGLLIVAALYFAREVFIPLALAALIAFLLAPLATRLRRLGLPKTMADLLVAGLALAAVGAVGWLVLGQVYNLAIELPQYQQNLSSKVSRLHLGSAGKLTSTVQMLTELNKQISGQDTEQAKVPLPEPEGEGGRHRRIPLAGEPLGKASGAKAPAPVTVRVETPETPLASMAAHDLRSFLEPLAAAFAVVVFVVFMLMSREDIRDRAVRLVGESRIHITTVAMTDAGTRVSRYLLMQFVVNLTYGGVIGLGLWAIGVPHPLLWAVLTALLRFIPYVGILAAGAGPVLVALAVSPTWRTSAWTFGLYVAMELISANAVEPWLYGASTGISALAILVAAIFWTWLWGIAGLLLSTPLTVCLIVLGRHVPTLEFLGVLFGEKTVLDPPQRLYQRVLAGDDGDAARLMDEALKSAPHELVYDNLVIPALSLIEEARHAEELDTERAELALRCIQELIEEHWSFTNLTSSGRPLPRLVCVAVRDVADRISCEMLAHLMADTYDVRILNADALTAEAMESILRDQTQALCVVGLPPQAIRYVRLRCHQLRTQFPEMTIMACVLSLECDMAEIRSRIPLTDAQHVVCSVVQAMDYVRSLVAKAKEPSSEQGPVEDTLAAESHVDLPALDVTSETILQDITQSLVRGFEAPMALLHMVDTEGISWRAQCGLPEDDGQTAIALEEAIGCLNTASPGEICVVPDTSTEEGIGNEPLLRERSVRFLAGAPLFVQDGRRAGSLFVFDTRPRQISEQQKTCLRSLADSAAIALELRVGLVSAARDPVSASDS